jgi:hypothetical protein
MVLLSRASCFGKVELMGVVLYKGHGSGSTDYVLRGWSMEFFVEAFKMFDIKIWCATDAKTTLNIMRSILFEETIKKICFVRLSWHILQKDSCSIRTDCCRKTINFKSLAPI